MSNNITLNDLINLEDGTKIDADIQETANQAHDLLKEEMNDLLSNKKQKIEKNFKNSFYENVPNSKLKNAIGNILKNKNQKEELLKKKIKFEFDRKMQRINKIKSRTYRKMLRKEKAKKNELLQEIESEEDSEQDSTQSVEDLVINPLVSINQKPVDFDVNEIESEEEEIDEQKALIKEAFEIAEENGEDEFRKEKKQIIEEDAPKLNVTVLPGWGSWAGENLEVKKTKYNTVTEVKEGIRKRDRADFSKSNVIINEHLEFDKKAMAQLPYGYNENDYKQKMDILISEETNSLRIFKKFVKIDKKSEIVPGKNVEHRVYENEE